MNFGEDYLTSMESNMQKAFLAMAELEASTIANPDEKRIVYRYWLRNPAVAPTPAIRQEIQETLASVKAFAAEVHQGVLCGASGPFKNLWVIGVGGSVLGPQFVAHALGHPNSDKPSVFFFDDTDPDGMDKVLTALENKLGQTLCMAISKYGGTTETRNVMPEAEAAYKRADLNFAKYTVAVTGVGSELDKFTTRNGWLKRFQMCKWVEDRTSEFSAAGMQPTSLQ